MKENKRIVLLVILGVLCLPLFCFASDRITAAEVTPRIKKITLDENVDKTFFEKGKTKNLLAVSAGYDSNTHLDSRRIGDAFVQTFFKTTFTSPLNKTLSAILEYEIMNLLYTGESKLDLLNNGLHAGLEKKINKNLTLSTGYYLDWTNYINTGEDDFVSDRLDFKIKQDLPFKAYHSFRYELSYQNYSQRHTRSAAVTYSDKKRSDFRDTLEYEVGKYLPKDLYKLGFQYYYNDSNETYLKYYDYDSYKISASLTHLFNDKVFGYASFGRQFRDYRTRPLSLDSQFKEWDRTYLMTSSLYYNWSKSLTIGLSYTYRENWSNEPVENYSGSLISLASYYRF